MNRKMSKRQKDIKSKLMAAICMLLVSSIMMVSTTYAWFTLSTAPEVKGISTAIGANGNLEMALVPLDGDVAKITSNQGDSMTVQEKTKANVTWGNLVDLQGAYGLEGITLYPSALNVDDETGLIDSTFPLKTPEYGTDGRVTELVGEAQFGTFEAGSFKDKATILNEGTSTSIENFRGVRAIGTVSGATQAQLDYKAALVNASNANAQAIKKASGILSTKGGALADIAIKHANSDGNEEYSADDIANLSALLDAILGTDQNPGSLLIIRDAYKEYLAAYYIAENPDAYETTVDEIRDLTDLAPDGAYVLEPGMAARITALNASIAKARQAKDAIPTGGAPYEWGDIRDVVEKLANPGNMTLNGHTISEVPNKINELFNDFKNGRGFTLYMASGAGIFVDIADHCGDYAASINISKIEYGSISIDDVPATMQTQSAIDKNGDPYLTAALGAVNANGGPDGADDDAVLPLSDFYGYVIDLAFRTNVAGSNLQLRTEGVDRIYSENDTNEATMGGGSTMIFKSNDTNFGADRMIELMKYLKVVLFDPDERTIIKNLVITNATEDILVAADGTVTAPLYIADATTGAPSDDANIVALDQNTIKKISVLVYLDGAELENQDVANAAESMEGALNLQFGSSVPLVPMEYADLKNGTVESPGNDNGELNPTISDVTTGTVTTDYAAVIKHIAVGETYKIVAVVTDTANDNAPVTTGTVTIGGETATYETFGGMSGWVVDGTATAPTTTVDVTVAPAAGG